MTGLFEPVGSFDMVGLFELVESFDMVGPFEPVGSLVIWKTQNAGMPESRNPRNPGIFGITTEIKN